ncbi:hypothetical protein IWX90DRAFT_217506 [Phyllosticta citrichinensis]|uniref:Secreted protein n=1 Tax=Phyllosticta citrichinensis TaxID=1130410 RepID=A0ABR1XTM0_9PEZI
MDCSSLAWLSVCLSAATRSRRIPLFGSRCRREAGPVQHINVKTHRQPTNHLTSRTDSVFHLQFPASDASPRRVSSGNRPATISGPDVADGGQQKQNRNEPCLHVHTFLSLFVGASQYRYIQPNATDPSPSPSPGLPAPGEARKRPRLRPQP